MLKTMFITNSADVAVAVEAAGVDWIFVDLEINGKIERQGHLNTVISRHSAGDVPRLKAALSRASLLVRVNPIFQGSRAEIDVVIAGGADIVMLPFFKTRAEVAMFLHLVAGRAKTCLLLETPEAIGCLDSILQLPGIDFVHIGLNDLHLGLRKRFMFELLADGTVDAVCAKLRERKVVFGFGGIARLGEGVLPADLIVSEHYRLGSSLVILSRSFFDPAKAASPRELERIFGEGIATLRGFEAFLEQQPRAYFMNNHQRLTEKVSEIVRAGAPS